MYPASVRRRLAAKKGLKASISTSVSKIEVIMPKSIFFVKRKAPICEKCTIIFGFCIVLRCVCDYNKNREEPKRRSDIFRNRWLPVSA